MTARLLLPALGQSPTSPAVEDLLRAVSDDAARLTQKDFGPVSYRSLPSHGLSLQVEEGTCKAVDLYNSDAVKGWSCYPCLPLELNLEGADGSALSLCIHTHTTGVELVKQLGEPQRRGGGEPMKGGGASGLGPGAWMEWDCTHEGKTVKVMIEMAGQEARGMDRWEKERAGMATWGVCTFALPHDV